MSQGVQPGDGCQRWRQVLGQCRIDNGDQRLNVVAVNGLFALIRGDDGDATRLGASPRATLALQRACQAYAAIDGRGYVMPDDVKALAAPVLAHRLIVESGARLRGVTAATVIAEILDRIAVPIEGADGPV